MNRHWKKISAICLLLLPGALLAQPGSDVAARLATVEAAAKSAQSAGDNAWMLVSSALVLMMTGPGLALFYGGLVRRKNVLATMMQQFERVSRLRFRQHGEFGCRQREGRRQAAPVRVRRSAPFRASRYSTDHHADLAG